MSKSKALAAPLDPGKHLPVGVPQKAMIFERARGVFRAITLHLVTCITFVLTWQLLQCD